MISVKPSQAAHPPSDAGFLLILDVTSENACDTLARRANQVFVATVVARE